VDALAADLRTHTAVPVSGAGLGDDLCDALDTHDVVIQGTPVGMYPNAGTSIIPAERLRRDHVVFDMVYRPRRTRLIEDAEALGCVVIHGLEMLANQAELQFERWTGVPAPKGVMRAALVAALEAH
jgi:shikimate dehydrogenase